LEGEWITLTAMVNREYIVVDAAMEKEDQAAVDSINETYELINSGKNAFDSG